MDTSLPVWVLAALAAMILVSTNTWTFLLNYVRSVWIVLHMPGPFAWPLIGNVHWAVNSKRLIWAATECPKKYGLILRAWLSVYPIVFLMDPQHIQKVLSNPKHVEKTRIYKMMHNFLGTGLITCDGTTWKRHRKVMQPYFNQNYLEEKISVFTKGGELLSKKIMDQMRSQSVTFNVTPIVNQTIFSILTEAVLGVPMESKLSKLYEEESPYRKGSSSMFHRLLHPWLLLPGVFNITNTASEERTHKKNLYEFTRKAMERRKGLAGEKAACFMDNLLEIHRENPETFLEEDCVHEACTLMLAGQDSVGAALAFTLHLLANHASHQEMVMDEQFAIFEGSERAPEMEDLRKMEYLERCIKEALRLYPSVPIIARTLGEDLTLGKYTLPKGCDVYIAPYATHRLPELYPNPETFDPDRFSAIAAAKRPPYSYLSFSSGPRNCIGYKLAEMEMKAVLSVVLRKFKLSAVVGKEKPNLAYRITLRASGGLWVTAQPRCPSSTAVVTLS